MQKTLLIYSFSTFQPDAWSSKTSIPVYRAEEAGDMLRDETILGAAGDRNKL